MYLTPGGRPSLGAIRGARRHLRGLGVGPLSTPIIPTSPPVLAAPGTEPSSFPPGPNALPTPTGVPGVFVPYTGPGSPYITPAPPQPAPIVVAPGGPVTPTAPSTPSTGTPSTPANTSGTPVPPGYPTDQIYVDPSTGAFWEFSPTQNTWVDVGTPYNTGQPAGTPTTGTYPNTPVPSTQPTSQPYEDSSGNWWVYNGQAWANYGTSGYFPGTAIPISTPTNELYTDAYGNQWSFSNGSWQLVASPASTTAALTAEGTPASSAIIPGEPAVAESGTQSLLDWFSESTLISGVPNWVLAAGAGIVAIKLLNRGKR